MRQAPVTVSAYPINTRRGCGNMDKFENRQFSELGVGDVVTLAFEVTRKSHDSGVVTMEARGADVERGDGAGVRLEGRRRPGGEECDGHGVPPRREAAQAQAGRAVHVRRRAFVDGNGSIADTCRLAFLVSLIIPQKCLM